MSHINFGDTGLIVQYIQNFLKDNYNKNIHLSDEYDKETHKALIEYLKLPEIMEPNDIKDLLLNLFTFKEDKPPHKLIDGGGIWNFNFDMTPDKIIFWSRDINQCFNGAIEFVSEHMDDVDNICRLHGWKLAGYTTFKYNKNNSNDDHKIKFTITKDNRKQLLPSSDIIKMINLSMNDYLLGKCFLDENNAYHGFIQDSSVYKISYIPAKPGETFTISHGYKYPCELAIAYTNRSLLELKHEDLSSVENIVSHLARSKYGELNPGDYDVYTIPEDAECTYLLIQMPYKNNLISPESQKIRVKIGDINQDGKIDYDPENPDSDYRILKDYVEAVKEGKPHRTLSGANLVAANINQDIDANGNQIVNEIDVELFRSKAKQADLNNEQLDFGETIYNKEIDLSESDYDRLLVMFGNIEENNYDNNGNYDNHLNIPLSEFQTNPWIIHENFLSYILGASIHKYSDERDITWLQEQIEKLDELYDPIRYGLYDEPNDYVSNDYILWNDIKGLYEYYQNGLYSGYVLVSEKNDIQNATLRRENDNLKTNMKILNGRFIINNEWTGKFVLSNGIITTGNARYSLKSIIKTFQLSSNDFYKNQTDEQIKFISGNVDPITEKRLKFLLTNYIE